MHAPQRILVVCLDNLGDLVFTSSLTIALRERFPHAGITLWCKRYTAPVGPLLPGVDEVEAAEPFWDRAPGGRRGSIAAFARSVMRLRQRRFDLAILASAPWRTAVMTAATGAARRIGLARRRNAPWLTDLLPAARRDRPVLVEMARLLEPLGIVPPPRLRYALDARPLDARRVRLRSALGRRTVALHPFASRSSRCVPLMQWVGVAGELSRRGLEPLWIGRGAELAGLRALAGSRWRYVDEVGDGSLGDSAAAISLAELFVGHDSGPLHLAGGFGVPVAGVFTPGEPERTFPQGAGASRLLVRSGPAGVTARDILDVVDALPHDPPRLPR